LAHLVVLAQAVKDMLAVLQTQVQMVLEEEEVLVRLVVTHLLEQVELEAMVLPHQSLGLQ
jgi:hypothetical protein